MSLIKCPECGKEKVSDSAESCPECGYGIKAHFDKIKREETAKRIQQRRMDLIEMPQKPKFSKVGICLGFLFFLFSLIGMLVKDYEMMLMEAIGIGIIALITLLQYSSDYKRYKTALTDFEQYKRDEIRRQDIEIAKEASKIRCPQCGSSDTKKITTSDRMASTAMFGVASSKIGKQYECKSCGHKW